MRTPIRKPGKYTHRQPDPHISPAKLAELRAKLSKLKEIHPRAAEEVKRLGEMGDFSENAGYAIAKGRLRGINQRILELERELRDAEVITPSGSAEKVQLGRQITVITSGQRKTYTILGSTEADPTKGIISHNSPMSAALMGHRVGDVVQFESAGKNFTCTIVKIE